MSQVAEIVVALCSDISIFPEDKTSQVPQSMCNLLQQCSMTISLEHHKQNNIHAVTPFLLLLLMLLPLLSPLPNLQLLDSPQLLSDFFCLACGQMC